jgi:hypothetical protein
MFITLSSLVDWKVGVISLGIVSILYLIRYITLKVIVKNDIIPQLYIAPRGLITILLFFVIKNHHGLELENFDEGILLYVIIITSFIMTWALIKYNGKDPKEVLLAQMPTFKVDEDEDGLNDEFEKNIEDHVEKRDFNDF